MKKPLAALLTGLVLTGCTGLTTEQQAAIDNLTPCEKINALLGAYDNRFEGLKRSRVNTKYMETWTAKYNLIADNCQITALDKDNVTYRCVGNYEQQQQAVADHTRAVNFTQACLAGNNWHQTQKESAESLRTTFVLDENNPVISIHSGTTLSRKQPWSTTLEIGKPIEGK